MVYFIVPSEISFFTIFLFLRLISIDIYEYSLFNCCIVFHFTNIPYIIHPFLYGWAFRLFLIFSYYQHLTMGYP